jgi:transposase
MGEVITIGLDIAKSVFQVHGVDAEGTVVIRKRTSRAKVLEFFAGLPRCLIGIEACATAHHWSRELQALGHSVRLMPPSYVKAYLKRNKNDANDAAAICEAVQRPTMRCVATKSKDQQAALMLHRTRQLLVRQRTMLSNAMRGHLAEFGIVSAKGRQGTSELLEIISDAKDDRVPGGARLPRCSGEAVHHDPHGSRRDREAHSRLASLVRGVSAPGRNPRYRPDCSHRLDRRDRRLDHLFIGPKSCGLTFGAASSDIHAASFEHLGRGARGMTAWSSFRKLSVQSSA